MRGPAPLAIRDPRQVKVMWPVICTEVEVSGLWRELYSRLQEKEKQAAKSDSTGYYQVGSHAGPLLA